MILRVDFVRKHAYHNGPTRSDTLRVFRHARKRVYGLGASIVIRVSEDGDPSDVREGVLCKELVRLTFRLLVEVVDSVAWLEHSEGGEG